MTVRMQAYKRAARRQVKLASYIHKRTQEPSAAHKHRFFIASKLGSFLPSWPGRELIPSRIMLSTPGGKYSIASSAANPAHSHNHAHATPSHELFCFFSSMSLTFLGCFRTPVCIESTAEPMSESGTRAWTHMKSSCTQYGEVIVS